jgi:hypothetical protein
LGKVFQELIVSLTFSSVMNYENTFVQGHLRQRAETIAREVLKEDQAQEALLRATAQANRQAKSEAQQQATLQHLRQKAEALVVLEPPHQRKNNTYLPHLSRKALGFEPPGEALRRPSEEIAASFRLSSSSSTRKDSAATPPIPLPAATTAQAGAAAPVHTEESGGAAVNTGSNESSGECKSAMPLQDPES